MRVAIVSALCVVALLTIWLWPRASRTPVRKVEVVRVADERTQPRELVSIPVLLPYDAPVAPRTLCGTEVLAVDPEDRDTRVPRDLLPLASATTPAEDLLRAYEDAELDRTEDLDFAAMLASARDSRAETEAVIAETTPPARPEPGEEWGSYDWLQRSLRLRSIGRVPEALQAAEQAHRLDPSNDITLWLASVMDDAGQVRESRRLLERQAARASEPSERAWAAEHLGFYCVSRGDDACAARSEATIGSIESPQSAMLQAFLRGVRGSMNGSYDDAVEAYTGALEQVRDFPTLHNLAEVEVCRGRPDSARARYREAMSHLNLPDDHATLLAGIAFSYLSEGDLIPAWLSASSALAATADGTNSSQPRKILALTALQMGDLGEGRTQVHLARQADPNEDLVHIQCFPHPAYQASLRALVAEDDGDHAEAQRAWLEVARSGHPTLAHIARRALTELCPLSWGSQLGSG